MAFFSDLGKEWLKITWQDTHLLVSIDEGNERVNDAVMAILESKAPDVEAHMKINAPWTDQTGNARQGLRAEAYERDGDMGIILYHQVPYGVWLELKYSGRDAIILPTIQVMGPEVMASLENILGRIKFA